ncbi:hypothetical protein ABZW49_05105 [Nonomuraea wenchangensis]
MAAWGPALFSDDLACDVRDDYRRLIEDGVPDAEGAKVLARREAALLKARAQLTGPQPARRRLRPPWRHVTDLSPGAVLAYRVPSGDVALLRVVRARAHTHWRALAEELDAR